VADALQLNPLLACRRPTRKNSSFTVPSSSFHYDVTVSLPTVEVRKDGEIQVAMIAWIFIARPLTTRLTNNLSDDFLCNKYNPLRFLLTIIAEQLSKAIGKNRLTVDRESSLQLQPQNKLIHYTGIH
jgi:hypothetical protein